MAVVQTYPVSILRRAGRWAKRARLEMRRDMSRGEVRKWENAALNWREFWHGQTQLRSYPRHVQVGTNWTCNLKCNFCRLTLPETQGELKARPKNELEISPGVLDQVLDLLPYPEMLTLTPLGEPLLYSKVGRILERHRQLGCRNLAMTTNANLINDDRARMLVEGGVNHLFVSIDSSDDEVYAGMRVLGNLPRVEAALDAINHWKDRLNSPTPTMTLCSTFMERNVRQMPDLLEFAARHRFGSYSIQLMATENVELESEYLGHHTQLAKEMLLKTLRRAEDFPEVAVIVNIALRNLMTHELSAAEWQQISRYIDGGFSGGDEVSGMVSGNGAAAENGNGNASGGLLENGSSARAKHLTEKCHYPWYFLMIDTDGDCRPCCWAGSSYGNLNGSSVGEIWNGPAISKMRRDFLNNHIPKGCQDKHCRVDLDHAGTME